VANKGLGINAHDAGLASIIKHRLLLVPPNLRSYAWEDSHVQILFAYLPGAIDNPDHPYFLGTIVLTQGKGPSRGGGWPARHPSNVTSAKIVPDAKGPR